jgi:RNA polymerase sigma-70 factor (ECF subfamily)
MTDEQLLVKRICDGDSNAFRELVESQRERVYFLSMDLTGNQQDAEDLSQEVFIKAFCSIQNFKGESKISTWLYRITVNVYIDGKRRKRFLKESLEDNQNSYSNFTHSQNYNRENFHPENYTEEKMIQFHIEKALQKLSPRERSVFVLRHYQELDLKEISELLNVAEGTVKSLLFRAIQKLQTVLAFYRREFGLEGSK